MLIIKPVVVPNILKVASLTSVIPLPDIFTSAVDVFAPGTENVNLLVLGATEEDKTVHVLPLSKEYSMVWFPVMPALSHVITSLDAGFNVSPPLG